MSAEIVNLKLARKRRARVEKDKNAEQNRQKFGEAKADKSLRGKLKELDAKRLDDAKKGE